MCEIVKLVNLCSKTSQPVKIVNLVQLFETSASDHCKV